MAQSVRGFVTRSHRRVEGTRIAIDSWVRGAISPSRRGDEDSDRFVGSWRDLTGGRGGSIGSWVRGTISPSRGRDEDGDLTSAISNSTT